MGLIIVAAATRRRKVEEGVMVDGCWCVVRSASLFLCECVGKLRDDTRGTQWKKRLNLSCSQDIFLLVVVVEIDTSIQIERCCVV